jgi:hypothetical protein
MARLVMVEGTLALTAALLAGCGGGDDHAKVEASLQHYLANLLPEQGLFPLGLGPPRVKHNGCKDRHIKFERPKSSLPGWSGKFKKGKRFALWSCVVRLETLAMPVLVAVDDSTEVVFALPGKFKNFKLSCKPPSEGGASGPGKCRAP